MIEDIESKCDWCGKDIPLELKSAIMSDFGLHCSRECLVADSEKWIREHPEEWAKECEDHRLTQEVDE